MGANRSSFAKLQRDRDKKAKAAAKRESRLEKGNDEDVETPAGPVDHDGTVAARILESIEALHKEFDGGSVSLEDFEERKADLMARLPLD
jgi:hypothetical protein